MKKVSFSAFCEGNRRRSKAHKPSVSNRKRKMAGESVLLGREGGMRSGVSAAPGYADRPDRRETGTKNAPISEQEWWTGVSGRSKKCRELHCEIELSCLYVNYARADEKSRLIYVDICGWCLPQQRKNRKQQWISTLIAYLPSDRYKVQEVLHKFSLIFFRI